MLTPSDKISEATNCYYNWLLNAGTSATSRTLKLQDKNAYDVLKNNSNLPAEWQIGSNCTVLDKDGNAITEQ